MKRVACRITAPGITRVGCVDGSRLIRLELVMALICIERFFLIPSA